MAEHDEPIIRVVVCDAGPLIHLDELNCLALLSDFPEVLVPTKVWSEVGHHRPNALSRQDISLQQVDAVESLSADLAVVAKLFSLDAGELEALRIVRERKADLLLTDDTAARLAAGGLAIPVHGTIGILLRSIRRNLKSATEVATILRSLPSVSTLHIKRVLLEEILHRVDPTEPGES